MKNNNSKLDVELKGYIKEGHRLYLKLVDYMYENQCLKDTIKFLEKKIDKLLRMRG